MRHILISNPSHLLPIPDFRVHFHIKAATTQLGRLQLPYRWILHLVVLSHMPLGAAIIVNAHRLVKIARIATRPILCILYHHIWNKHHGKRLKERLSS